MASQRHLLIFGIFLLGITFGPARAIGWAAGGPVGGAGLVFIGSGPRAIAQEKHVVLKGQVECIDAQGRPVPADKDCGDSYRLVLHSQDGQAHSFVANDALGPMLADRRVRQRTLQITAVPHPDGQIEALTVQSIKDGKLYDIYYFCQLCNITTYTPGLCPCCRQELEFKEAPATGP